MATAAAAAAIEARRRRLAPDEIEVGPREANAVALFYALGSQWRIHAISGDRLGIDYAAVAPTAVMLEIGMTADLFADLRVMENAALLAFAGA